MNGPYRVQSTPTFERDFKKLDATVARRVRKKIVDLAAHPERLGQSLRNMPKDLSGLHKCRVGTSVSFIGSTNRSGFSNCTQSNIEAPSIATCEPSVIGPQARA